MLGVLTLIVTWCQRAGSRPNYQGSLPSLEVFKSVQVRPLLVGSLKSIVFVRVCLDRCTFYMAAVSTTAKIPSPLNLSDRLHQGENWKSFRREWKFYELAAGIHKKAQEVRVASLLNVISKEGMDMYETFQWGNSSDALKIDKVLEKFEERCVPARNETYERYVFFKREQWSNESLNSYITALMKLSESCGFGALRESLVRPG